LAILKEQKQVKCFQCGTLVDVNQLFQYFERSPLEGNVFCDDDNLFLKDINRLKELVGK
jgi:hypothetical protein